jgi:hypothetical protein
MSEILIEHNIDALQRTLATLPTAVTKRIMKQVAQTAEREMLRRYRRTVSTWTHQPQFTSDTEATATSVAVIVGTDSPVYAFVDRGTKPHAIVPKRPGYPLRFRSDYQAKTAVGVLNSGAGGASGDWVRAMRVWHPGTKARRFTEMIFQEIRQLIFDRTIRLLDRELRRHFRALR